MLSQLNCVIGRNSVLVKEKKMYHAVNIIILSCVLDTKDSFSLPESNHSARCTYFP